MRTNGELSFKRFERTPHMCNAAIEIHHNNVQRKLQEMQHTGVHKHLTWTQVFLMVQSVGREPTITPRSRKQLVFFCYSYYVIYMSNIPQYPYAVFSYGRWGLKMLYFRRQYCKNGRIRLVQFVADFLQYSFRNVAIASLN